MYQSVKLILTHCLFFMYYLPTRQDPLIVQQFHCFPEQESRLGGFHQPVQGIQIDLLNLYFFPLLKDKLRDPFIWRRCWKGVCVLS